MRVVGSFVRRTVAIAASLILVCSISAHAAPAKSADLSITKIGPASVAPGENVVYTVTVTNNGPNSSQRVRVYDPTPSGLTFVSNSGACTTAFPCSLGSLTSGATRTITSTYLVPATYDSPDPIVNTASVSGKATDPDASNDSASVSTSIATADLSLAASGPVSATPGAEFSVTFTVTNAGPSAAQSVNAGGATPVGLTFVSNSGACDTAWPCALGTLEPGQTRTITTTYAIPASYEAPDPIVANATVSATALDPVATDNTAALPVALAPRADLAVSSTGPASATPGQEVAYTITVINDGESDATAVRVEDAAAAQLTFVSNAGDCTGSWPCLLGKLPAGASRTIVSTYFVPASYAAPGPLLNTASVSAATHDPDDTNNSATVTGMVAPSADLSIASTAPGGVTPGANLVYSVTVTNNGSSDAASVVVEDQTPAGLTFVSNAGACTTAYPCALGTVAAGGTRTITSTYYVPPSYTAPDPIVNTASVSSATSDPQAGNNAATISTAISSIVADLSVSHGGPETAMPGTVVVYTTTITNNGPSDAPAAQVQAATPPGLAFVSTAGACTTAYPCSLGTIPSGQTRTITTTYAVPASYTTPDPILSTSSAWSAAADPAPEDDTSSASTAVTASADLAVLKSSPVALTAGQELVSVVTVTNDGPSDARSVTVADATPAGVVFVSNSGACVGAFPCSLGRIPAGAGRTITTTYLVPSSWAGPDTITDTATVSSTTADPQAGDNASTTSTSVSASADLAIVTAAAASAVAGSDLLYAITVANNGASDASAVTVSAPTPAGLAFVANSGDCASEFPCSLGSVPAGSTRTILSVYRLPSSYSDPSPVVHSATVSSATTDPDGSNNVATATTAVTRRADLSVHQTVPGGVTPGTNLVLTVAVTNSGPSDAESVSVTDATPQGLTFVSNQGACAGAYPCALGTVPAGATRTITTTYSVPPSYSTPDPIQNTAAVSSATTDPAAGNNAETAYVDVSSTVAELAVTADGPASVTPGTSVLYTVVVTNNGPSNASGVLLEAPTPPGTVLVSNTGACTGAYPCLLGAIASGASVTVTSTYRVPASYTAPAPLGATFLVSSDDADPVAANNVAGVSSALVPSADLAIAQSAPTAVKPGHDIVYTTTVSNAGSSDATSVVVAGSTPSGLAFVSNAGGCATAYPCALGTIPAGATRTIVTTYRVPAEYRTPDPIGNAATVTSATGDPEPGNNATTASTAVLGICGDGVVGLGEQCDGEPCCDADSCQYEAAGTVCRPGSGDACDPDESCSGSSADCPDDVIASTATVCRTGSGDACDPDESCTGVAQQPCPADVVRDAATPCRASRSDCDVAELCPGTAGAACPDDAIVAAGTPCAADGNPCTDDVCDGAGACGMDNAAPCDDDDACTSDDTCSAGSCTGSPVDCDDADLCSQDTCDPTVGCANTYEPAQSCFEASRVKLKIKNSADDAKDKLFWSMNTHDTVTPEVLGDPTADTRYALCFYDLTTTDAYQYAGGLQVPAREHWSLFEGIINYKDKQALVRGVKQIHAGSNYWGALVTQARVKGTGRFLDLPVGAGPRGTFKADPGVVVQLVNDEGTCWSSDLARGDFRDNNESKVFARQRRLVK